MKQGYIQYILYITPLTLTEVCKRCEVMCIEVKMSEAQCLQIYFAKEYTWSEPYVFNQDSEGQTTAKFEHADWKGEKGKRKIEVLFIFFCGQWRI